MRILTHTQTGLTFVTVIFLFTLGPLAHTQEIRPTGPAAHFMEQTLQRIEHDLERIGGWNAWNLSLRPLDEDIEAMVNRARTLGRPVHVAPEGFIFGLREVAWLRRRFQPTFREGKPLDDEPFTTIKNFAGQLDERGIRLVVVPVPLRVDIYRELYSPSYTRSQSATPYRTKLIHDLLKEDIHTIDLYPDFRDAVNSKSDSLYPARDLHWGPPGIAIAAKRIAEEVRPYLDLGREADETTVWSTRTISYRHPKIFDDSFTGLFTESHDVIWSIEQVMNERGEPFSPHPGSPVLVAGDSFVALLSEPGAGIAAHISKSLGHRVSTLRAAGAGPRIPHAVARFPGRSLTGKKVIIWIFTGRMLSFELFEKWVPAELP